MEKLTAAKVKSISKPGPYGDGGTLFMIADNKVAFDRTTKKGLKYPTDDERNFIKVPALPRQAWYLIGDGIDP